MHQRSLLRERNYGEFEREMPNGFEHNNILTCAGARRSSVCDGDSGSALFIETFHSDGSNRYTQLAIVQGSYNYDSDLSSGYPSIFTRLQNPEINDFVKKGKLRKNNNV